MNTFPFLSAAEAAKTLGVHRHTVRALMKHGLLKGVLVAGRWAIERSEVEELAKTYVPAVGRPPRKRKRRRA